jgi:hypothetical protein
MTRFLCKIGILGYTELQTWLLTFKEKSAVWRRRISEPQNRSGRILLMCPCGGWDAQNTQGESGQVSNVRVRGASRFIHSTSTGAVLILSLSTCRD